MPTNNDDADQALFSQILRTVEELHAGFRDVQAVVEDQKEQIKLHRDIVFRSINMLNHEVVGLIDRLDKDDANRAARVVQIDTESAARKEVVDLQFTTIKERLETQDDKLDTLATQAKWRTRLIVAILIVCSFVALRVALVWIGVVR